MVGLRDYTDGVHFKESETVQHQRKLVTHKNVKSVNSLLEISPAYCGSRARLSQPFCFLFLFSVRVLSQDSQLTFCCHFNIAQACRTNSTHLR